MKQYYPYDSFCNDVKVLRQQLEGFDAEAIVTIARGGYMLAHALAESLGVRTLQSVQTQLYDGMQKRDAITMEGSFMLEGKKRVLLVDDIADSGETLDFVMHHLQKNYPEISFCSATLFYKKSSIFKPTYYIHEATSWIEFFWEKDFLPEQEQN